jgi:hypothetical protein
MSIEIGACREESLGIPTRAKSTDWISRPPKLPITALGVVETDGAPSSWRWFPVMRRWMSLRWRRHHRSKTESGQTRF